MICVIRSMAYLLRRFFKVLFLWTEGYRIRDKLLLVPYSVIQALMGLLRLGGLLALIPGWYRIYWLTVPPFNVILKNRFGLFHCRGGTDDLQILCEYYESAESAYLQTFHDGVVIDIGAHVGRFSILVANEMRRQGSKDGKVVAVEPHPSNYAALEQNVLLNQLTNVTAFNLAGWSENTEMELYFDPHGRTTNHSIVDQSTRGNITVRCATLDSIVQESDLRDIRVIKIDVEGASAEVLEGAAGTLQSNDYPPIIVEGLGEEFDKCKIILERYGYTLYPMAPVFNRNYLAVKDD